jgi:hypothetical protein
MRINLLPCTLSLSKGHPAVSVEALAKSEACRRVPLESCIMHASYALTAYAQAQLHEMLQAIP